MKLFLILSLLQLSLFAQSKTRYFNRHNSKLKEYVKESADASKKKTDELYKLAEQAMKSFGDRATKAAEIGVKVKKLYKVSQERGKEIGKLSEKIRNTKARDEKRAYEDKKEQYVKEIQMISREIGKLSFEQQKLEKEQKAFQVEMNKKSAEYREAKKDHESAQKLYNQWASNPKNSKSKDNSSNIKVLKSAARNLMNDITKGYLDSRFLLNDMDKLVVQGKIDRMALEQLRNESYRNLNNTIMGSFVNGQIKKLSQNLCEYQNQCLMKNANSVSKTIDILLDSPEGTKLEFPQGKRNKIKVMVPGKKAQVKTIK